MYAFYSLLVLVFYALFKKGDAEGQAEAGKRGRRPRRLPEVRDAPPAGGSGGGAGGGLFQRHGMLSSGGLTELLFGPPQGVTDSEKRIHNLTVENEGLKHSLQLSQGLLAQAAAISAQPSALMATVSPRPAPCLLRASPAPQIQPCGGGGGKVRESCTCHRQPKVQGGSIGGGSFLCGGIRWEPERPLPPPHPSGNIRVLCRLKPLTGEKEQPQQPSPGVPGDGCLTASYKGTEHHFKLDKVFPPCATQEEVFLEIEPVVLSCLQGYNVCIFAYGQTGSGKTYTMEGVPGNPGINQRALRALQQEMEAKKAQSWTFSVHLTMVEIYNEAIRRELHLSATAPLSNSVHLYLSQILQLGKRNRTTFSTHMNAHSSRSHALLTLTLTGKLNLVDLAGSERVWKSGAQGERLKEAQSINRSLLALGEVIQALRTKQAHVPFRNSRLTYLLQDSLGKGSKTVMMVQICPLEKNVGESICSLKFAQRVCQVELGPASRRVKAPGPARGTRGPPPPRSSGRSPPLGEGPGRWAALANRPCQGSLEMHI
uniref:Kinesin-like protein n=1 Tax=Pseudonaja textilis TaxID=8673 RepID=A0A670Z2Q5_PSETE